MATATEIDPVNHDFDQTEVVVAAEFPVAHGSGILDEAHQQPDISHDLKNTGTVSPELRARCLNLGMSSAAVDGWAQYHTSPAAAMTYNICGQLLLLASTGYLLTGCPFSQYFYSIPYVCSLCTQIVHIVTVWRTGPNSTLNPFIQRSMAGTQYSSQKTTWSSEMFLETLWCSEIRVL